MAALHLYPLPRLRGRVGVGGRLSACPGLRRVVRPLAPDPASPAGGGGEELRPPRSELPDEGELGAIAIVVEGLGVGIALLAHNRKTRAEAEHRDRPVVDRDRECVGFVLTRLAVDGAVGETLPLVFGALQGGAQPEGEAGRQRQRGAEARLRPGAAPVLQIGAAPAPAGIAADAQGGQRGPGGAEQDISYRGRRASCSRGSCAGPRSFCRTSTGAASGDVLPPGAGRNGRSRACRRSIAARPSPAGLPPFPGR